MENSINLVASNPADIQAMLKASVLIEEYKKDVKALKAEVAQNHARVQVLAGFVRSYLDTFEAAFDSDESQFNYEQMQQYIEAAIYMEKAFDRYRNRIMKVAEVANRLPY
jgi:hypothetical protein